MQHHGTKKSFLPDLLHEFILIFKKKKNLAQAFVCFTCILFINIIQSVRVHLRETKVGQHGGVVVSTAA